MAPECASVACSTDIIMMTEESVDDGIWMSKQPKLELLLLSMHFTLIQAANVYSL
jgi:hypothetical protein